MKSRFKIICSNCGESCNLEEAAPMVHANNTSVEVKHDAVVDTCGITEFYFEISCSQCGNTIKLSL